jgi:hypothetical protein
MQQVPVVPQPHVQALNQQSLNEFRHSKDSGGACHLLWLQKIRKWLAYARGISELDAM